MQIILRLKHDYESETCVVHRRDDFGEWQHGPQEQIEAPFCDLFVIGGTLRAVASLRLVLDRLYAL